MAPNVSIAQPRRCGILAGVKWFKTAGTIFLLALWLPATSHSFLESVGVIHEQNSPDTDSDHDAADGLVLLPSSVHAPAASVALICVLPVIVFLLPEPLEKRRAHRTASGPSPPLPNLWQFVHRAALLARAPSFAA